LPHKEIALRTNQQLYIYPVWEYADIISLICFSKIDFSEQYHIKGVAWDTRCNVHFQENISTKAFS
jgi:hypothetical protein